MFNKKFSPVYMYTEYTGVCIYMYTLYTLYTVPQERVQRSKYFEPS